MSEYALALSETELGRYALMAEVAAAQEAALWQLAGIADGARIADVGCGPAAVTAKLAQIVGADGFVVGVDENPETVATANEVLTRAGISNAEVRIGSATNTGLDADSFDVVVMRHVLAHNGGVEPAIVEHLASLVRPGGSVYLVDTDLSALRFRPRDPFQEELWECYDEFHKQRGNDTSVGLVLDRLLRDAGLDVAAYEGSYTIVEQPSGFRAPPWAAREAMLADAIVTEDQIARWEATFPEFDGLQVRPTLFAPSFVAVGRKPLAN